MPKDHKCFNNVYEDEATEATNVAKVFHICQLNYSAWKERTFPGKLKVSHEKCIVISGMTMKLC